MAQLLDLLIFLVPPYIANSSPVVLGGGMPLDLGKSLGDGSRMLGDSKTVRGFVGGVLAGTFAGGLITSLYLLPFFPDQKTQFIAGFVLSVGTLVGDSLGSFIKRRMKVESGKPFLLDTIMFLLVALVFVYPFANSNLYEQINLAFFFVLTLILHPVTNIFANRVGLKKVPW